MKKRLLSCRRGGFQNIYHLKTLITPFLDLVINSNFLSYSTFEKHINFHHLSWPCWNIWMINIFTAGTKILCGISFENCETSFWARFVSAWKQTSKWRNRICTPPTFSSSMGPWRKKNGARAESHTKINRRFKEKQFTAPNSAEYSAREQTAAQYRGLPGELGMQIIMKQKTTLWLNRGGGATTTYKNRFPRHLHAHVLPHVRFLEGCDTTWNHGCLYIELCRIVGVQHSMRHPRWR